MTATWITLGAGAIGLASVVTLAAGRAIHDPVTIHHRYGLVGDRDTYGGGTIIWERRRQGWKAT